MLRKLTSSAIWLLTLACAPVIQDLDPASPLQLGDDEGLLILHVDTDTTLARIAMNRGEAAASITPGHHVWVVRASAGEYRWKTVHFAGGAERRLVGLENDDEFSFRIAAGSLNYPGALVVRSKRRESVTVRVRNRAAMAVRRLRNQNDRTLDRYPVRYAGRSGDSFLERFSTLQRQRQRTPAGP